MDDSVRAIMQSELPNALQLTWIAMWGESEGNLYLDSLTEIADARGVSRQAISQQVQRLCKWGAAERLGNAIRLMVDVVKPELDSVNPGLDDVKQKLPLSSFPFSPKKVHSTPFTPSLLSPEKVGVESASADQPLWLRPSDFQKSLKEPLPDDHPARWEYHPGDWRWEAGRYVLRNLRDHEMLNTHYRRRLSDGVNPGKIASEWADTFRLLVEQDGWQREEVAITMQWLFETENWWRENRTIQSAGSLRKKGDDGSTKFDKILQSALADHEQRQEQRTTREDIEQGWDRAIEEVERELGDELADVGGDAISGEPRVGSLADEA